MERNRFLFWRNKIRLTAANGYIYHSGQKKPLKVKVTEEGIQVGCTFVSKEAAKFLYEELYKWNRQKRT
jgi:hypothetical protein